MSKMLSNAEEIARHVSLEGHPREIVSTMMTVANQMKPAYAYAAIVGLLAGLGDGKGYMAASITSDVEGLREDYTTEELAKCRDEIVEAFAKAVDARIAARIGR